MIGLGQLGLTLSTLVRSSGGPTELWVQPAFDASTGVTLGRDSGSDSPTIAGGLLTFVAGSTGYAYATSLGTLVAGTYRIVANATGGTDDGYSVFIGGTVGGLGQDGEQQIFDGSTGIQSHDLVVGAVAGQLITIYDLNAEGPILTSFSVEKIA